MNNSEKIKYVLPSRIRSYRNSKNLSQEQLAEKADIHPTYVSRIESGKKLPTLHIICKIADIFGVSICELFMDEESTASLDYKRKKLINIVRESKPIIVEWYFTLIDAVQRIHRKKK